MARISDPDKLSRSDEASTGTPTGNVFFDLTNKTIELLDQTKWVTSPLSTNALVDAGYNDGGVDLQALYSFIKEQWRSEADLIQYPFPMEAITAEQFEFINGWTLTDATESPLQNDSKKLIRNGGYAERDANGTIQKEYAGIISLGTIADEQARPYYAFADDVAKTDAQYNGPVNEAILIFDRTVSPNVDNRSQVLTLYVRPVPRTIATVKTGWLFAQQSTTDIGVTTIATQAYRFPLASAVDINIDSLPSDLTGGVYDDMRIEYYSSPQSVTIDGSNTFEVGVIIDANIDDGATEPTVKQIYNWVQNELRSTSDLTSKYSPTPSTSTGVYGVLTDRLLEFVGDTLKVLEQDRGQSPTNNGVFIEGVGANDLNNVEFIDNTGTAKTFEFKVALNLDFNSNVGDDPDAKYFLFFTTIDDQSPSVKNFGTGQAIIVDDDSDADISGDVHFTQSTGLTGPAASASPGAATIDASANTLTDTGFSPGWATDELAGKILRVYNGSNAGSYYIESNTLTTVTIETTGKIFDADDTGVAWAIIEKNTAGGSNPRITKTFNYAANNQGGRTANSNADVTLVALGLDSAQYATQAAEITRTNSVTISISNPLERNYEDPQGL